MPTDAGHKVQRLRPPRVPLELRKPSSTAGDGNSQQEGDQQRAKRGFARDIAQDAQRHSWLSSSLYRARNPIGGPLHGVGDFRDRRFRL